MSATIVGRGYCPDDLLLIPKYSEVRSRKDVDLSVRCGKDFKFSLPIVPSNMKTITEMAMARLMFEQGGMAIFHRFTSIEQQKEWFNEVKQWNNGFMHVGFSVGVKPEDKEFVKFLIENGVRIICIDVAHGHSKNCLDMIKYVRELSPFNSDKPILLIAGNVATFEGAQDIWKSGADVCKISVGNGSICLTRIQTGNGVPSITTMMDCANARFKTEIELNRKLYLMQDGGCKTNADFVKCLCFVDLVLSGNCFAGTDECAGEVIEKDGKKYKSYVGSSTHRGDHKEGVKALKLYRGSAVKIIQEMREHLASGCSYQGVFNLTDLKKDPQFIEVSHAGIIESNAHDLDEILE